MHNEHHGKTQQTKLTLETTTTQLPRTQKLRTDNTIQYAHPTWTSWHVSTLQKTETRHFIDKSWRRRTEVETCYFKYHLLLLYNYYMIFIYNNSKTLSCKITYTSLQVLGKSLSWRFVGVESLASWRNFCITHALVIVYYHYFQSIQANTTTGNVVVFLCIDRKQLSWRVNIDEIVNVISCIENSSLGEEPHLEPLLGHGANSFGKRK